MTHCDDHSGVCVNMTNLSAQLNGLTQRMDAHQSNGGTGHVQRHEIKTLAEDVSTLTTAVKDVVQQVADLKTERKVEDAGNKRTDRIWQTIVPAVAMIVAAVIALLK